CANISLDIDSNQEVVDVCRAWREEREFVAQETAILTTIETLRDIDFSESEIREKIMAKYNLSEKKAAEYMIQRIA
ncbi:MAG: hypothetical protein LUE87_10430, partial [Lachnospiraceae bacterium]|nr:hypothetical protein [Lachnospiraceae bacterium]